MKQIKTESGFECEVDEEAFDDMRFLQLLQKVDENPLNFDKVARKIMGDDATERLYDHIENKETKKVPVMAFANALSEIMEKMGNSEKKS